MDSVTPVSLKEKGDRSGTKRVLPEFYPSWPDSQVHSCWGCAGGKPRQATETPIAARSSTFDLRLTVLLAVVAGIEAAGGLEGLVLAGLAKFFGLGQ